MTDKELKKCSRRELLELLLHEAEENERLRDQLQQAQKQLAEKQIAIESSGTLAEAALKLNAVFEAADAAAKQYLENIKAGAESCGEE